MGRRAQTLANLQKMVSVVTSCLPPNSATEQSTRGDLPPRVSLLAARPGLWSTVTQGRSVQTSGSAQQGSALFPEPSESHEGEEIELVFAAGGSEEAPQTTVRRSLSWPTTLVDFLCNIHVVMREHIGRLGPESFEAEYFDMLA